MDFNEIASKYAGDVYLYHGDISRQGYHELSQQMERINIKSEKVCLILITYGGDPDAAFRIARCLNHYYNEVEVLVPDLCKSAGTLVCVGAHKLIFGDRGELGPLDIQLSKPDELFESMSGLDIIQALNALEGKVLESFRNYLTDIRSGGRLRTKLAADIATKLADGFISPIAAKIDPVTLGEHNRAMQIAYDYGRKLSEMVKSISDESLMRLISGYPSHGFVIDRKEAAELFSKVEPPDESTIGLYNWAQIIVQKLGYPNDVRVFKLETEPELEQNADEIEKEGLHDEQVNDDERRIEESEQGNDGESEPNI